MPHAEYWTTEVTGGFFSAGLTFQFVVIRAYQFSDGSSWFKHFIGLQCSLVINSLNAEWYSFLIPGVGLSCRTSYFSTGTFPANKILFRRTSISTGLVTCSSKGLSFVAVGGMYWNFSGGWNFVTDVRSFWTFAGFYNGFFCSSVTSLCVLLTFTAAFIAHSINSRSLHCISRTWCIIISLIAGLSPRTKQLAKFY